MNAWEWYQANRDHVQFATLLVVTVFVAQITLSVVISTIRGIRASVRMLTLEALAIVSASMHLF